MRLSIIFILLFVFPFPSLSADYHGNCSIVFQGSSTLHDFEGKASCQPFIVSGKAGVMTVPEVRVAINEMDTDNSKRDVRMREMFDSETYPLIFGSTGQVLVDEFRKALNESTDNTSEIVFQLKIRDIEQPVTAVLKNVMETGSAIVADLSFALFLPDYQLKPPSFLGLIRVGKDVDVTVSFSLDAQ